MRTLSKAVFFIVVLVIGLRFEAAAQNLIHRYSFDENANDLAGEAHGELVGDASITDRSALLSGTKPSYVNLPNDLVTTLTSASFEVWVTWRGGAVWQRIWDFGNNDNSEDLQGTGVQSIFLTPNNGGGMVLSIFPTGIGSQQVLTGPALPVGGLHQIVWTYDAPTTTGRLYVDGVEVDSDATMTHTLAGLGSTVNNWLGHSQYPDFDFNGSIAEFRIYDGALSAADVAAHFSVGPDPSGRGELVGIRLAVRPEMRPGSSQRVQVIADYQNVPGIDVTADAGVVLESGDTAILTTAAGGIVTAGASASGNATITARLQGKTASESIKVTPAPPAVMLHRYTFDSNASDSVGTAHGELVGGAQIDRGAVVLSGQKPSYVNLPNDLFTSLTDVTIETWANWRGGGAWQRLWDFGNSSAGEDTQGAATQSFFFTPDNGGSIWLSIFPEGIGGQQAIGAPPIGPNQLRHIAFTFDSLAGEGRVYLDGVQIGINTNMTYTLAGLGSTANNWLGHSQYVQDSDFNGSILEFRIYNGALTAQQVAANSVAGPDPSGRGNLVTLHLIGQPTALPGLSQQLRVEADFENVAGVNVTSDPGLTFELSNPAVFSITAGGLLTASASTGSADVTVRFQGKSATQTFQVVAPVAPVLRNRYSFTADAADSVGGASGELVGDASIVNGEVVLTGTKPSYVNLPNDLFTNLTDVTFEIWVTWRGGGPWQRIWDFGNNNQPAEDLQGDATLSQSIFLTPNNGGGMVLSIFPTGIGNQQVVRGPALSVDARHHVVWTYAAAVKTARLFVDGVEVGSNTAMTYTLAGLGPTMNNWLGHSQYIQDADFRGSIAEFRIYTGTFLDADVAARFEAGPDALPADTASRRLGVAAGANNQLVISWPTGGVAFTLESSASVGTGASWGAVGTAPVVANGRNEVTVQASENARFYRLRN